MNHNDLPYCPYCNGHKTRKNGFVHLINGKYQLYHCVDCDRGFSEHSRKTDNYPLCPRCNGDNVRLAGYKDNNGKPAYRCHDCMKTFCDRTIYRLSLEVKNGEKICRRCMIKKPVSDFSKINNKKNNFNSLCKVCDRIVNRLGKVYGLTEDEYENIKIKQNYICPICKESLDIDRPRKPCIDHDHTDDAIRGILCDNCNKLIGFANDNIIILQNAIDYLLNKQVHGRVRSPRNI